MQKKLYLLGVTGASVIAAYLLWTVASFSLSERNPTAPFEPFAADGATVGKAETAPANLEKREANGNQVRGVASSSSAAARLAPTKVDSSKLEKYVGDETARVIAAGGPFESNHVRTIAHALKTFEKYMAQLRNEDAPRAEIERATQIYVQMQNQYYAALDDIEPYEPNEKSAQRVSEWNEAMNSRGGDLNQDERKSLKREILLHEDEGSAKESP